MRKSVPDLILAKPVWVYQFAADDPASGHRRYFSNLERRQCCCVENSIP
ncbi:MAG: hypothetical protein OEW00_09525 [candidate division Zixibacteria bacterium]|nr:hypothetical protein [candidate division Zixibacteria bacterium]